MSTPKVRLSNVDRGINIFTAVNTYQSRKLNEKILEQQYRSNNQLALLRSQMSEANAINKQILANQLEVEKHKEAQKYYKALSFNLLETIDIISKINDWMVLNYVLVNFYDKLKANITEANYQLDEIGDKSYNKQTLEKLNEIKSKSEETLDIYKSNVLNTVDNLIVDFKSQELKITSLSKPDLKEEIFNRKRIKKSRIFGIVILGLFTIIFYSSYIDSELYAIGMFFTAIFAVFFFIQLFKEVKSIKGYDQYLLDKKIKEIEFQNKKLASIKDYEAILEIENEKLSNHPLHSALAEISDNHPTFDNCLFNITELETSFAKKWGIDNELVINSIETDQAIISLCEAGKQFEAVAFYRKETGLKSKEARAYVENIVVKNKITPKTGCFVATACYGNYDAPEVLVLRQFRDNKLLKIALGRLFVNFYYSVSPYFAKYISKSVKMKKIVRAGFLTPIVSNLKRHYKY